ncbi:acetyl-CoA acetyltransferase [Sphingorhabdus sp.]|uniref:acetyl-CoA acetyltransferase n=1 Tax=Sphingorhabdus sp. TaxID=1902408 RepID=UPI0032B760A5
MTDSERIPVIIGVGQINDRPEDPDNGLDPLGLMVEAMKRAETDSGVSLLSQLDSVAVVDQISFRHLNPLDRKLADALGASPSVCYQSEAPHGDTPIRLLNEAANRIGAGEIKLAAVGGAEALRTIAGRLAKHATPQPDVFEGVRKEAKREPGYAQQHGLNAPVDVYPLYENAGRASYGQTLTEAQQESGEIWSRFSQIAAGNEGAWIRKPTSPNDIITSNEKNRPLAFPYNKLMVANSSVNQGAGFIVASLAEARRLRVAEDKLIYVGMGAAAKEAYSFLQRDRYDRSVSMETSIRRTLDLNKMSGADFDFVELYSCFPCVPKMARRILGWPVEKPATVFGGLTFGGGPIANYMSHAVVSMVDKLRHEGTNGFLFANGGFATDNHCIVLSNKPVAAAHFPQNFDYQAEADAGRETVPELDKDYVGIGTVETYTVFYGRDGSPKGGVVVARTPAGERTLAHVNITDDAMVAFLTDGQAEPVGTSGAVVADAGGRRIWARA